MLYSDVLSEGRDIYTTTTIHLPDRHKNRLCRQICPANMGQIGQIDDIRGADLTFKLSLDYEIKK